MRGAGLLMLWTYCLMPGWSFCRSLLLEGMHWISLELSRAYAQQTQQQPRSLQSVCTATALNLAEGMHCISPELPRVYAQHPSNSPKLGRVHVQQEP